LLVELIFTRLQSKKILIGKLGNNILNMKNVIIDSKNKLTFPEIENEIYPMIVYIKNGAIDKIQYQSPNQNGFENLLKSLK